MGTLFRRGLCPARRCIGCVCRTWAEGCARRPTTSPVRNRIEIPDVPCSSVAGHRRDVNQPSIFSILAEARSACLYPRNHPVQWFALPARADRCQLARCDHTPWRHRLPVGLAYDGGRRIEIGPEKRLMHNPRKYNDCDLIHLIEHLRA